MLHNIYLYNSSHKLSPYVQRVVLHHIEGHCTHYQHMLLVVQVYTTIEHKKRDRVSETKSELTRKASRHLFKHEGHHLVAKSYIAHLVPSY